MPIASSIGGGRGGALSLNLTGATAATRYAGGTTTGAPTTGTFAAGDHVVAQDGRLWICLVAGTPGTWRASDGLVFAQSLTADTATLDTGASGIPAGFNVIEALAIIRTDEAAASSVAGVRLNADSASVSYDRSTINVANTTLAGVAAPGASAVAVNIAAGSDTAAVFTTLRISIPAYAATVANKSGELFGGIPDQTAANMRTSISQFEWRNTAAVNQLTLVITSGSGQKFKTGSSLFVYVR